MAKADESLPSGFRDAASAQGQPVEVLNLGAGATNLPEYFPLIRDSMSLFRPDHLILVLYPNDLPPPAYHPSWLEGTLRPEFASPLTPRSVEVLGALARTGRLALRWPTPPFSFLRPVPDPLNPLSDPANARRVAGIVEPRIAEAMRRGRFNPYMTDSLLSLEALLEVPVDMRRHLAALQEYLGRFSSRLSVVYLPTRLQVSVRYFPYYLEYSRPSTTSSFLGSEFQRQAADLRASCAALGIAFLDTTPALREAEAGGTALYWDYDEHMRGVGYHLAGRVVYEWWGNQ